MLRFALAAAGFSAYLAAVQASVSVTISNSCSESVALYDNSATTTLASGSSTTRTLANSYVGMFRNGVSDQATLVEISDGKPWYDISIIPPSPGSCTSLSACQSQTGKTGFNTAMQITPQDNVGSGTCKVLTCEADGCSDAYQYPSDDTKTHTCPGGSAGQGNAGVASAGDATKTSNVATDSATSTQTTGTSTTTNASGSDSAVQVTTQSSNDSTSSLTYIVVFGGCVVGIAAGGFIYAVQKKKKALDMEAKSPFDNGERSCRNVSVLVSTPATLGASL
ncbi:hypothetical protein PF008_g19901 [Phytophthora fragariae]|uniref:Uncharacterized protein n=1 Tax=Phytophthora fragariae TaxID=53985 RepID=A0A6A3FIA8_9STRA|nr:hypothetical protein PF009_g6206 [Phytophthora fragariae]KAE9312715.1 hypothetical protein PF008_g19901 [Phytophthora fragariae]